MLTEAISSFHASHKLMREKAVQICYQHQRSNVKKSIQAADFTCLLLPVFHTGIPVMLGRLLANQVSPSNMSFADHIRSWIVL